MTTDLVQYLNEKYPSYRVDHFGSRRFHPDVLDRALTDLCRPENGVLRIETAGASFENRPIRIIEAGHGPTKVLLWSQMHGDESTATMAICDLLNFFAAPRREATADSILSSATLYFIPMINPDGAAVFQRRTKQGIDMNRDARLLQTPEARLLRKLQQDLKPVFGFNLHDQELSTVGQTATITAMALLAPAHDPGKGDNAVRLRAKQTGAVFAEAVNHVLPGRLAKYDDAFEPRAFGDSMQMWGTSTLLVESGHVPGDHEKEIPRKLNFIGLLVSLYSIATGRNSVADTQAYENLPFNGKRAYDVVVRNVLMDYGNGMKIRMDLGISSQVDTHSEPPPKLVDMGDLGTFAGLEEIDANGKMVPASGCRIGLPFDWEHIFR